MSTVDKMMRRYLTSARDFEAAEWAAKEDLDKLPLWERAALAGMCAFLLKELNLADGATAEAVAEEMAAAAEDGQDLSVWVSNQLLGYGLEAPIEATSQPAPSNAQPWKQGPPLRLNEPMVARLRQCAADTSSNWDGRITIYPPEARELVALIDASANRYPHQHCGQPVLHVSHNTDSRHWCSGDPIAPAVDRDCEVKRTGG